MRAYIYFPFLIGTLVLSVRGALLESSTASTSMNHKRNKEHDELNKLFITAIEAANGARPNVPQAGVLQLRAMLGMEDVLFGRNEIGSNSNQNLPDLEDWHNSWSRLFHAWMPNRVAREVDDEMVHWTSVLQACEKPGTAHRPELFVEWYMFSRGLRWILASRHDGFPWLREQSGPISAHQKRLVEIQLSHAVATVGRAYNIWFNQWEDGYRHEGSRRVMLETQRTVSEMIKRGQPAVANWQRLPPGALKIWVQPGIASN